MFESFQFTFNFMDCFSFCQMLNPQPEKTFIRNKAAQVFALLFVTEYLTKWPKFFFDILSVVNLNPRGVDLYLRILMAVDSELVDRDVVHTSEASHCPFSGFNVDCVGDNGHKINSIRLILFWIRTF